LYHPIEHIYFLKLTTMVASDFLLNLVQAGLVLIGLIGVLYYFFDKKEKTEPRDHQAARFIFSHAMALIIFSLFPFPIFYAQKFTAYTWIISAWFLSAYVLFSGITTIYRVRKIKPSKLRPLIMLHIVPSLALCPLLVIYRGSIAVYLTALIWLLLTCIMQLRVAIFVYIHSGNK
jgi:hypothetical protein